MKIYNKNQNMTLIFTTIKRNHDVKRIGMKLIWNKNLFPPMNFINEKSSLWKQRFPYTV